MSFILAHWDQIGRGVQKLCDGIDGRLGKDRLDRLYRKSRMLSDAESMLQYRTRIR